MPPPTMNLPNTLTLVRMFLVPLLVVVLLTEFEGRRSWACRKEIVGAGDFRASPRSPTGSTATWRAAAGR